jgi:hypothetical protein
MKLDSPRSDERLNIKKFNWRSFDVALYSESESIAFIEFLVPTNGCFRKGVFYVRRSTNVLALRI